jgi:hypothetical protein
MELKLIVVGGPCVGERSRTIFKKRATVEKIIIKEPFINNLRGEIWRALNSC